MEIVSIILRLKHQEIKVTVDEAKELLGQLTAVFGGEKPIIQKEYVPYGIPYPVYPQPRPWYDYPWYTKPYWEYQPILVFDNGDTGNIKWQGNTCSITSGTTGDLIDSLTYAGDLSASSGGTHQSGDWLDKNGISVMGSYGSGSAHVEVGTGTLFTDVKSDWNLGGSVNSASISVQ